jgi:hypothetical protein
MKLLLSLMLALTLTTTQANAMIGGDHDHEMGAVAAGSATVAAAAAAAAAASPEFAKLREYYSNLYVFLAKTHGLAAFFAGACTISSTVVSGLTTGFRDGFSNNTETVEALSITATALTSAATLLGAYAFFARQRMGALKTQYNFGG